MPVGPGDTGGLIEGLLAAGGQEPAPGAGSELLTFLFADIRGYTGFTQQHGDEAAAKLTAKFATIVRDLITGHGGVVFELRGDEAMCVFDRLMDQAHKLQESTPAAASAVWAQVDRRIVDAARGSRWSARRGPT